MRVVDGLGDLDQNGGHATAAGSVRNASRDQLLDGGAFNQLHAVEAETVALSDVKDRHDVGMVEARRCAGLQAETFPRVRAGQVSRRDGLQCHQTSQTAMTRAIHHPLASSA